MKPPSRPKISQLDLFNARFEQLLNHQHSLYVLANKLDWNRFDLAFEECYSQEFRRFPGDSEFLRVRLPWGSSAEGNQRSAKPPGAVLAM